MYKIEYIKNKILNGDSLEELKKIPSESIDFIFADPPYFMQTEGELLRTNGEKFNGVEDEWDKFDNFKDYDEFLFKWLVECKRILKKDATICVIGSFQNIFRLGYILQNLDFWILNDIIWEKSNPVPNFAGTRFCNAHETLIWCSKTKKSKFTFNYKTMKYLNSGKQERSVWKIPICNGRERLKDEGGLKIHLTQKPEALLYKIILATTKIGDIVLDPFFGTGTTGAVAKEIGRNFIGIEKEKKYISVAKNRIDNTRVLLDNIVKLTLETKPPKVTMENLIDKNYLKVDSYLYSPDMKNKVKILKNGNVLYNEEELSIHKMSAKFLNKKNHNGWSYFFTYYNDNFIAINELRYIFDKKENKNE